MYDKVYRMKIFRSSQCRRYFLLSVVLLVAGCLASWMLPGFREPLRPLLACLLGGIPAFAAMLYGLSCAWYLSIGKDRLCLMNRVFGQSEEVLYRDIVRVGLKKLSSNGLRFELTWKIGGIDNTRSWDLCLVDIREMPRIVAELRTGGVSVDEHPR